jgi:hypothetical protein
MQVFPCHKTVIDMVLHFAFPYIHHIPTVRLQGCIKTDTKRKWERILLDERRARQHGSPHGNYDWATAYSEYEGIPPYVMPLCQCPLSCNPEDKRRAGIAFVENIDFDAEGEFSPELVARATRLWEENMNAGHSMPRVILFGPHVNLNQLEADFAAHKFIKKEDYS